MNYKIGFLSVDEISCVERSLQMCPVSERKKWESASQEKDSRENADVEVCFSKLRKSTIFK